MFPGLRHRGPDHVRQHGRLVPPPGQLQPGQDEHVLGMAAHASRQAAHGDQARPPPGVVFALAELVDEPKLTLHQGLAAAADSRLIGHCEIRRPGHVARNVTVSFGNQPKAVLGEREKAAGRG